MPTERKLEGKKILLGITGSIAAYKSILLVRLLVKAGAEVKVIMTPATKDFVSPLVLETLSKNPVLQDLSDEGSWANHVMLGRWADIFLIAPASCNTIAKMASGICDNLLLAVYLSATCPVAIAPAMDEDMWAHASTRENLAKLRSHGVEALSVGKGELASGLFGEGRMLEPDALLSFIAEERNGVLSGKKVVITAGPTHEAIDPVRFIGNHSSGKMGVALASSFRAKGADVTLVMGPGTATIPGHLDVVRVTSAREMFDAVKQVQENADILVMSAAVADYRPKSVAEQKIKKGDQPLELVLIKNPDILAWCGENKKQGQMLIGFALETDNGPENAMGKMKRKNADMIVLNSLGDAGAGFGTDTNKVVIFEADGTQTDLPLQTKNEVADKIVDRIIEKMHA